MLFGCVDYTTFDYIEVGLPRNAKLQRIMVNRPTVQEIAERIAVVMALRSEDPWTKVGAVALTDDNRIIATAYNGLLPGVSLNAVWKHTNKSPDREYRLPYMIHAEQNLCSLIKRGEASWCVVTICPCPSCLLLLACHGIKKIVYLDDYARDNRAIEVAKFYNIELCHAKTKI